MTPFATYIRKQLILRSVEWHVKEGDTVGEKITHCATVRGPVRNLLLGERVALNTLARCSGIATKSDRLLTLLRKAGYAAGSITNAVRAAKSAGGFATKVEVECQSFEEADEAIAAGADIVMLDNFTPDGVKVAAAQLKEKWGRGTGDRKAFLVEEGWR